jgi:NAD(P)-dependent dehydrogenase (short-subunit alcohol dehydrogenase family)
LAPGFIETDLNRDFLASEPAGNRQARALAAHRPDLDGAPLLASDAGRWMTGSIIVVDGGHAVGAL